MLELQSNPRNIAEIEPYVNQVVQAFNISDEMYGNILISLTEAVNNAIVHGNQEDENKKVKVRLLEKAHQQIAFLVSDEGRGFNYDELPDPTAPENLLKLGGRGVFLMRQLADTVEFLDNGSTVEIKFSLE